MTQDSRQFTRFQPICWNSQARVMVQDKAMDAAVVDESLGGLGLELVDSPDLRYGQIIRINDGRLSRRAKLVYLAKSDDGQLRLGIEWMPDSEYEEIGMHS